jgi:hypothetical protein
MVSVTQRIKEVKQPRGGYLPIKLFSVNQLDDERILHSVESVSPSLVGICVDYLTRFMKGTESREAFRVSIRGAQMVGMGDLAEELLNLITGLDDRSIKCACHLVSFDVVVRVGVNYYKPFEDVIVDTETIENIRIMVERSLSFFELYGPLVKDGFYFIGGYTDTINTGDGDFITKDTLWDFKVTKSVPTKDHTLQVLIYYIMGLHSNDPVFRSIENLGFYNPRNDVVYQIPVSSISSDLIKIIEDDVICYK